MAVNQTLKINNISKELDIKSKEILDILSASGYEGKTHSATLKPEEFSLVIHKMTLENQVIGIDAYMNGDFVIQAEAKETEVKHPEPETAEAAPPAEKRPSQEAEKKPAPKNQQNNRNLSSADKLQRFQAPVVQNKNAAKKKQQIAPANQRSPQAISHRFFYKHKTPRSEPPPLGVFLPCQLLFHLFC